VTNVEECRKKNGDYTFHLDRSVYCDKVHFHDSAGIHVWSSAIHTYNILTAAAPALSCKVSLLIFYLLLITFYLSPSTFYLSPFFLYIKSYCTRKGTCSSFIFVLSMTS
jgi:hypothetical protein